MYMLKCLTTISKESTPQAWWKRRGPFINGRDIVYSAWKHAAAYSGRDWISDSVRILMSTDLVLGAPTNIAGYAILAHLFAKVSGQKAVELIMDLGNAHVYEDHFDGVRLQLSRPPKFKPTFEIVGLIPNDLFGLQPSQFILSNYVHHSSIKFNMSV